jgi:hypothetical protein
VAGTPPCLDTEICDEGQDACVPAFDVPCDLNGDEIVDATDRNIFLSSYRLCAGDAGYLPEADFDDDGCITLNDYREWYKCYKNTTNSSQ